LYTYLDELMDSRAENEQGMTTAPAAEEYKLSSLTSSPNAGFDNDVCKSRYIQT
jgi:hypothetical protein